LITWSSAYTKEKKEKELEEVDEVEGIMMGEIGIVEFRESWIR